MLVLNAWVSVSSYHKAATETLLPRFRICIYKNKHTNKQPKKKNQWIKLWFHTQIQVIVYLIQISDFFAWSIKSGAAVLGGIAASQLGLTLSVIYCLCEAELPYIHVGSICIICFSPNLQKHTGSGLVTLNCPRCTCMCVFVWCPVRGESDILTLKYTFI